MTTEQNKELVRRTFEQGMNQNRPDVFDELIAGDYVNHDMPAPTAGPEGFKQVLQAFKAAFPDMRVEVEEVIGEGDRVATRGTMYGTHRGEFNGIPATGIQVAIPYVDIWRLESGKARENWVQLDMLGLLQQLGVIPAPEQAPV